MHKVGDLREGIHAYPFKIKKKNGGIVKCDSGEVVLIRGKRFLKVISEEGNDLFFGEKTEMLYGPKPF